MALSSIQIGNLQVSRFILGGNPFSGFSHQGSDRDQEMIRYYTAERIQQTFRHAEDMGINTFLGRGDQHIIRMLREYRDNGGTLQWIGQTCPEMKNIRRSIEDIITGGAQACFIHGGQMDFLLSNKELDEVPLAINMIKEAGLKAGVAGHNPQVHQWAEKNLDVDFYMCSYYNSSHRDEHAEHISGMPEWFKPEDRDIMVNIIRTLHKPVIHYKIMAAGRNDPAEAFRFTAHHLRANDAVCVGIYSNDKPDMIGENIRLFEECLIHE
ncbi:MAG: hypothetical protein JXB48_01695 [Candidatus Latescibacteria bacterium]|nr:hypothetical protein [Candidatus Latescibacterota bacterium]